MICPRMSTMRPLGNFLASGVIPLAHSISWFSRNRLADGSSAAKPARHAVYRLVTDHPGIWPGGCRRQHGSGRSYGWGIGNEGPGVLYSSGRAGSGRLVSEPADGDARPTSVTETLV